MWVWLSGGVFSINGDKMVVEINPLKKKIFDELLWVWSGGEEESKMIVVVEKKRNC